MLNWLHLHGVGPEKEIGPVNFAERLNFITGDNGLGKSFLLDIAWWSLTRTWARDDMAIPQPSAKSPKISYSYTKAQKPDVEECTEFNFQDQAWPIKQGRPPIPGVVIYAGVDGSFSAWDPARNYWNNKENPSFERLRAFNFTPNQVWNGLESEKGIRHCNGLIQDWIEWQLGNEEAFHDLTKVLETLSPSEAETMTPGKPVRVGIDVKKQPSLNMPYGESIPLIHASAGMRRIAALAYLLVWTWKEHEIACKQMRKKPAKEIIFLVDEIESHLHPQWQRRIVPALLQVMKALTEKSVPIQLLIATHSPLVLASAEAEFNKDTDKILTLELNKNKKVELHSDNWEKQGDAVNWLVSEAFGLKQARSVQAEEAIEAAESWMRGDTSNLPIKLNNEEKIHKALEKSLPSGDHFWPRWIVWVKKQAGEIQA